MLRTALRSDLRSRLAGCLTPGRADGLEAPRRKQGLLAARRSPRRSASCRQASYTAFEGSMKYKIAMHKSDEGYSVLVPGLPGCWSQGATEPEALEHICDTI